MRKRRDKISAGTREASASEPLQKCRKRIRRCQEQTTAQLASPFGNRTTGIGDPAAQGAGVLANLVRREAYVLSYIDAFWLTACVSLLGILLILLLRPPPPNPMIPSRGAS